MTVLFYRKIVRNGLLAAYFLDESFEDIRMFHGELREHFAIKRDVLLLLGGDELAVGDAIQAESVVQTGDPERTEGAFFVAAIAVGICAGLK